MCVSMYFLHSNLCEIDTSLYTCAFSFSSRCTVKSYSTVRIDYFPVQNLYTHIRNIYTVPGEYFGVMYRLHLFSGEPNRNPNRQVDVPSQLSHQARSFDAQGKLDRFERATKRQLQIGTNTSNTAGNNRATFVKSARPTDNRGNERNRTISSSVEVDANRESNKNSDDLHGNCTAESATSQAQLLMVKKENEDLKQQVKNLTKQTDAMRLSARPVDNKEK